MGKMKNNTKKCKENKNVDEDERVTNIDAKKRRWKKCHNRNLRSFAFFLCCWCCYCSCCCVWCCWCWSLNCFAAEGNDLGTGAEPTALFSFNSNILVHSPSSPDHFVHDARIHEPGTRKNCYRKLGWIHLKLNILKLVLSINLSQPTLEVCL